MKFVKLSVLALSMGLFIVSCGNSNDAAKTAADSAATATPPPPAAAPAPTTAATDTMNAAKPADTSKMAGDSKMDKKMEKK